jgi:hypothetical protein
MAAKEELEFLPHPLAEAEAEVVVVAALPPHLGLAPGYQEGPAIGQTRCFPPFFFAFTLFIPSIQLALAAWP